MAEELSEKLYTSKLNINGNIYYLRDTDAQALIAKLNGADTVEGSVFNSIKTLAQNADYGETTLGTALTNAEGKIATLNGDVKTEGSVKFQIYTDAKNAVYSITPAVTREATEDDITAGLATEVGEIIVVTPAKVTTLAEAIDGAANSIGNLTINSHKPDASGSVVLNASDIKRADSENTIESTLSQAESDIDAVEGRLDTLEGDTSVNGSVLKSIKDTAVNATYNDTKTIGEAIKAATDAVEAEVTRATEAEEALATVVSNLTADVNTEGSVKNTVYNNAQYGTFKFTGAEASTTIAAAIQANADAIDAVNNGKITLVESLPKVGEECAKTIYLVPKTASVENGGKAAAEGTKGYIEWVCLGDAENGAHTWEEIGDTDIDLTDYATKTYLIEHAKDANYRVVEGYWIADDGYLFLNRYNSYDAVIEEYAPDGVKTLPGSTWPSDTEIVHARYVSNTTITISDALDELFSKVSEGTSSIRSDLDAEIARATGAEEALDVRVTANETAIETLNGGIEVVGSVSNSIREQAKDATYLEATEDTEKVTISEAIAANETAISAEETRAKDAEDALATAVVGIDERVNGLEEKVTGTTVKSVNGQEANSTNGGAINIDSTMINYTEATETTYYTEGDPEVVSGDKVVGEIKSVGKEAVTVHDAIEDLDTRTSVLEHSEFSLKVNNVDATVNKENGNVGVTVEIDPKDIKMDKTAEGSITLFDKINNILGSAAKAITSVNVKEGTGTWVADTDDKEMLNWVNTVVETNDATFLVSSAE